MGNCSNKDSTSTAKKTSDGFLAVDEVITVNKTRAFRQRRREKADYFRRALQGDVTEEERAAFHADSARQVALATKHRTPPTSAASSASSRSSARGPPSVSSTVDNTFSPREAHHDEVPSAMSEVERSMGSGQEDDLSVIAVSDTRSSRQTMPDPRGQYSPRTSDLPDLPASIHAEDVGQLLAMEAEPKLRHTTSVTTNSGSGTGPRSGSDTASGDAMLLFSPFNSGRATTASSSSSGGLEDVDINNNSSFKAAEGNPLLAPPHHH